MNEAVFSNEGTEKQKHLPKKTFKGPEKILNQYIPASKPLIQAEFSDISAFCSDKINPKERNELEILSFAVAHCLSNQSCIAATLSEIGTYLKQLTENIVSANVPPTKKSTLISKTSNSSASNYSSIKSKDKSTLETYLQPILTKIEQIQSDISSKLGEYEAYQQIDYSKHPILSTKVDSSKSQATNNYIKSSLSERIAAISTIKNHIGIVSPKQIDLQTNANRGEIINSISNLQLTQQDAIQDTSGFSKCYDILSSENSHIIQHNVPSSNCEQIKPSKNFERYSQNTGAIIRLQSKLLAINNGENSKESASSQTYSAANLSTTANNSNKKTIVPAIKLDIISNTKSLMKSAFDNTNTINPKEKEAKRKTDQCSGTKLQTSDIKINIHSIHQGKDNRDIATDRFVQHCDRNERNNVSFLSAKSSPRDNNFGFQAPKESARLFLNSLPQKEIIDESLENMEDQTMQVDKKSMVSVDDYDDDIPHDNISFKLLDKEKQILTLRSPFEDFDPNTAKKERAIIKTLMKDQYGDEMSSSYHKADHGKMYQKKYLINAKWWREWKDFVNFDADDEGIYNKTSMYDIKSYPRPGTINNRDLLKQDAIIDPKDSAPEELELKDNLLEHHDYEAVNKRIYDVLSRWYGSDFEICRILKPDPFYNNKPYLEVYPKKRQGKRPNPKSMDIKSSTNCAKAIENTIKINLKNNPM